ncbi:MAG: 2OG-Fe(II) oxygenase [Nevskia sp.]|nr:2OG-Fe(II) oxygenase [Nevskia sp.]
MFQHSPVNLQALRAAFETFRSAGPFNHCVVDGFLDAGVLQHIDQEFLDYDSSKWFCYKNPIEDKKALNDWNAFPPVTYSLFEYLNSPGFVDELSSLMRLRLYADCGLHGGGWHCHGPGGNLNPHVDYSIHPKLGLQRKVNIIIYVSPRLREEHGGHLGLWAHDEASHRPGALVKEVQPLCNRAMVFDTTQNSWHGMSRPLTQPAGIFRQSLAIYYLCDPPPGTDQRGRALFAPRESQKGDQQVEEIIRLRSGVETSQKVYRT